VDPDSAGSVKESITCLCGSEFNVSGLLWTCVHFILHCSK
jgi:hypothetical protein